MSIGCSRTVGLVLPGGEPRAGKTRLARELQRVEHERSGGAIAGQCYEQEGANRTAHKPYKLRTWAVRPGTYGIGQSGQQLTR